MARPFKLREWRRGKSAVISEERLQRNRCRALARYYLRTGKIGREPCIVCDGPGEEMHHKDHSKPHEILWFCHVHHAELTAFERRLRRSQ